MRGEIGLFFFSRLVIQKEQRKRNNSNNKCSEIRRYTARKSDSGAYAGDHTEQCGYQQDENNGRGYIKELVCRKPLACSEKVEYGPDDLNDKERNKRIRLCLKHSTSRYHHSRSKYQSAAKKGCDHRLKITLKY